MAEGGWGVEGSGARRSALRPAAQSAARILTAMTAEHAGGDEGVTLLSCLDQHPVGTGFCPVPRLECCGLPELRKQKRH